MLPLPFFAKAGPFLAVLQLLDREGRGHISPATLQRAMGHLAGAEGALSTEEVDALLGPGENHWKHELSSDILALITSDCDRLQPSTSPARISPSRCSTG